MSIHSDTNAEMKKSNQGDLNVPENPKVSTGNNTMNKRYKESYQLTITAKSYGDYSKIAGIVLAPAISFVGIILALVLIDSFSGVVFAFVIFVISVLLGIVVGGFFYLLGVSIALLSKGVLGRIDATVVDSPFLTDTQKANLLNFK